jgi:phage terminase small subunit
MNMATPEGSTGIEADYWTFYAPLLAAARIVTEGDRDALLAYCRALAELDTLRLPPRTPETRRELRAWMQLARLCAADLGLNPASRARVSVVEAPADDQRSPLATLRAQGRTLRAVK